MRTHGVNVWRGGTIPVPVHCSWGPSALFGNWRPRLRVRFCRSRRDLAICVVGTAAFQYQRARSRARATPSPSTTLIRGGKFPAAWRGPWRCGSGFQTQVQANILHISTRSSDSCGRTPCHRSHPRSPSRARRGHVHGLCAGGTDFRCPGCVSRGPGCTFRQLATQVAWKIL